MSKSATVTSSAQAVAAGAKVVGVQFRGTATAGSVVLKDGGASGTVKLTVYSPASAAWAGFVSLGSGIDFGTDVYAVLTNVDGCTVIYDQV